MRVGRFCESETSLEWRVEEEEVEVFLLCRAWLIRDEDVCAESSESD